MPKRATLTFSSDDAVDVKSQELHVFYCKYSGQHAMTTDCDLTKVCEHGRQRQPSIQSLLAWHRAAPHARPPVLSRD